CRGWNAGRAELVPRLRAEGRPGRLQRGCKPNDLLSVSANPYGSRLSALLREALIRFPHGLLAIGALEAAWPQTRTSLPHAQRSRCRARRGALRTISRAARAHQRDQDFVVCAARGVCAGDDAERR